jgi:hypothetical protein
VPAAAAALRRNRLNAAATLTRARLTADPAAFLDAAERYEAIGARFGRATTLLLIPDRADEGRAELTALGVTAPR